MTLKLYYVSYSRFSFENLLIVTLVTTVLEIFCMHHITMYVPTMNRMCGTRSDRISNLQAVFVKITINVKGQVPEVLR